VRPKLSADLRRVVTADGINSEGSSTSKPSARRLAFYRLDAIRSRRRQASSASQKEVPSMS
jgi:hypothetical protein